MSLVSFFFLTENRIELTVAPAQHLQFASRKPRPIRLRHSLAHAPFSSVQCNAGVRFPRARPPLIVSPVRRCAAGRSLVAPFLSLPVAVGSADGATIFCHPCNVRAAAETPAAAAAAAAATAAAPNGGGCGAVSAQLHLCLQTYRTFTRAREGGTVSHSSYILPIILFTERY